MKINILRKMFHASGAIISILFYLKIFYFHESCLQDVNRTIFVSILVSGTIILFLVEYLRLHIPMIQTIFLKCFGFLLKEKEYNEFNASLPFFSSYVILFIFFNYEIATISILYLVFGDPIAAYFGSKYNSYRLKNQKSLLGFFSGFISAVLVGCLFLLTIQYFNIGNPEFYLINQHNLHLTYNPIWIFIAILISALLAFLFELLSTSKLLDDNLTIPLSTAISLTIFMSWIHQKPWTYYLFHIKDLFSCV